MGEDNISIDTSFATLSNVFNETRRKKIQCKPELIMESLQRFYISQPNINKIIPYIQGKSSISLRIIDWFVTKYSRKHFTSYIHNGQTVIVYKSYKGQLDAFNKIYFDTNCRRERIEFKIEGYEPLITTIGQLNFFRWALEIGLIEYIENNINEIKTGYNQYLKEVNLLHRQTTISTTQNSTESNGSTESAESANTIVISNTGINGGNNGGRPMTRRRRTKQIESSLKQLQIINSPDGIELSFN